MKRALRLLIAHPKPPTTSNYLCRTRQNPYELSEQFVQIPETSLWSGGADKIKNDDKPDILPGAHLLQMV